MVHAGPGGAEVVAEDVGDNNASLVYVLASDRKPASGYQAVGYVAKGPAAGPLVVGEFRTMRKVETNERGTHIENGDLPVGVMVRNRQCGIVTGAAAHIHEGEILPAQLRRQMFAHIRQAHFRHDSVNMRGAEYFRSENPGESRKRSS